MKLIANIVRVLAGVLFVFSGFIKINDPVGFSIKLEEYLMVFATDLAPKPDTLTINIGYSESTKEDTYSIILHNEPQKKITIKSEPWEHIEVKNENGGGKSFYDKSNILVLIDGKELYKKEIEKSSAEPYDFKLTASIGGKELISKTIPVYNNKDIISEESINLETYIKEEGWSSKLCTAMIPFTLFLAVFICAFEILLGIALLIGWKKTLTLWLLALMIMFFTFLTWYSAHYNKVTDCGCFGNAIPLSPWQSFAKDLVLCVFVIILIVLGKYIKPIFSSSFSWILLVTVLLLSFGFAFYCWYYLPVFNFLKFANGNDIEKLTNLPPGAKQEKREMIFIYVKNGKDYEFTTQELTDKKIAENSEYKFKERLDKVIEEGDKPEIHDFVMMDSDGVDHSKGFFEKDEYKLLMVSEGLTSTRPNAMKKIATLANEWTTNYEFWALTSSNHNEAEAIRHEYQFPFKFYYGDNTNLKSIIRSNPGLLLLKKGTVIASWPSTDLPSHKQLLRKMK